MTSQGEAPGGLVVVTGLSGAGKSTALAALADAGFYCVDNLPPNLASATVEACHESGIERVALGMDVRVSAFLDSLNSSVERLRDHPEGLTVLYLDAADEAIVRRFHETRRPHPILNPPSSSSRPGSGGAEHPLSVFDGVQIERDRLAGIRTLATVAIDTTHLTVHELRRTVLDRFADPDRANAMKIRVLSFGFKHGMPLDANLVFDVRFLDNPHFVVGLREKTGREAEVRDFVLSSPGSASWLEHVQGLLDFSVPRYRQEGKSYLTIAIGCTGGRHRSVALSIELARRLAASTQQRIGVIHRDAARGTIVDDTVSHQDGEAEGGT
ncbi:MAG: RNase adapter RapZ [Myxococcota bacterium]